MNLKKMLLGVACAAMLSGNAMATFCLPKCVPNPCNYGPKPEVSDCGGGRPNKPKPVKVKIVVIIIKVIFGC